MLDEEVTLADRNARVLDHPANRLASLMLVHQEDGKAWCRFKVSEECATPEGFLLPSVLFGLIDATSYLGLVQGLAEDEDAVTADFHVSVLRPVPVGAVVGLRAELLRRSAQLAFLRCEAQNVDGNSLVVASSNVTKVIAIRIPDSAR